MKETTVVFRLLVMVDVVYSLWFSVLWELGVEGHRSREEVVFKFVVVGSYCPKRTERFYA